MREIELRPKPALAAHNCDKLYIRKRGERVTISATIDGCGNEFCIDRQRLIKELGGRID